MGNQGGSRRRPGVEDGELARRWAALWRELPRATAADDLEGVHDLRVASRRVRAAMELDVARHGKGWHRSLRRTAKAVTRALGDTRDCDAALAAFVAARDASAPEHRAGADRLVRRAAANRELAHAAMVDALGEIMTPRLKRKVRRRFGLPDGDLTAASGEGATS